MEQAINVQSLAQKRRTYFKHPGSLIVFLLTWLAALLTMGVLVFLIGYILIKGVPFLTPDLFKLEYNSDNVSMLPSIINTVYLTALTLLLAVPIGIFSAIYLAEYSRKNSFFVTTFNAYSLISVTTFFFPVRPPTTAPTPPKRIPPATALPTPPLVIDSPSWINS